MTPDHIDSAEKAIKKGSEIPAPVGPRCENCQKVIKDEDAPPRFCCMDCKTVFEGEVSQAALRKLVFKRDKGVCAICGADTKEIQAVLESYEGAPKEYSAFVHGLMVQGYDRDRIVKKKSLWEADHVSPRVKGGPTTLKNARTLCAPCHYRETANLASSMGAARRKGRFGR
jgi:5-methylcytosine-specific restriction endonuclease McrA